MENRFRNILMINNQGRNIVAIVGNDDKIQTASTRQGVVSQVTDRSISCGTHIDLILDLLENGGNRVRRITIGNHTDNTIGHVT